MSSRSAAKRSRLQRNHHRANAAEAPRVQIGALVKIAHPGLRGDGHGHGRQRADADPTKTRAGAIGLVEINLVGEICVGPTAD